ncbi:GGDEF domain-containing protein [Pseudothermotoga thermarum]|uniref:Diguanylate cyclase n=1 Tax=Pseudothermotoga thermarum DSM 5069 TaxID=688269 RepID=F7YUU2_9THEM|nr:GGDEF domain-containing protein [Pseudothermotoga thermarum]AEH51502.1 diguanylate cyclase [Pseudothermotoga thermarum DSM 5069]
MRGGVLRGLILIFGTILILLSFFQPVVGWILFLNLLDLSLRFLIYSLLPFSKFSLLRFGVLLLAYSKVFSLFSHPHFHLVESILGIAGVGVCVVNLILFLSDDLNKRLLDVATKDSLTGLMNRYSFLTQAQKLLKQLEAKNQPVAVVFIDLNRFKMVNDEHGHKVGDKVLEVIGKRLKNAVKTSDLVGRLGGDEFGIFVQNADRDQAKQIVDRVLQLILQPIVIDGQVFNISACAGVAIFPEDGKTLEELIEKADREMYRVKSLLTSEICTSQSE